MPLPISKGTPSNTSPSMNRAEPITDVGSDEWMRSQGAIPMTPEESAAHRHLFACAEAGAPAPSNGKVIDLITALQKALNRVLSRKP
jgi:hypothetical protein